MAKCAADCSCGRHVVTEAKRERARQLGYANRGVPKTPEHRATIILNLKPSAPCVPGCVCARHSEESRERMRKIAESNVGRVRSREEVAAYARPCMPGCTCGRHDDHLCPEGCSCGRHDATQIARRAELRRGTKLSDETKRRMSASQIARWEATSPARKKEILKASSDGRLRGNGPSKLELMVREVLDRLGVPWLSDQKVSGFFPDLLLPDLGVLLEVNGCYWHACSDCFPRHADAGRMHKRDRVKVGAYRKAGYACAVVIEHEFIADPEGSVLRPLKAVI